MGMTPAYFTLILYRSTFHLPHLHCFIVTPRGNLFAIRGPSHSINPICMTTIDTTMLHSHNFIRFYLPNAYCSIITPAGNICTVRRPGQSTGPGIKFGGVMPDEQVVAGSNIP